MLFRPKRLTMTQKLMNLKKQITDYDHNYIATPEFIN